MCGNNGVGNDTSQTDFKIALTAGSRGGDIVGLSGLRIGDEAIAATQRDARFRMFAAHGSKDRLCELSIHGAGEY